MRRLLKRTVKTAVSLDLVELALQAVDGTKVWANASGDQDSGCGRSEAIAGGGGEGRIWRLRTRVEGKADRHRCRPEKMELREQVRRAMKELEEDEGSNRVNLTDGDARDEGAREDRPWVQRPGDGVAHGERSGD